VVFGSVVVSLRRGALWRGEGDDVIIVLGQRGLRIM